MLKWQKAVRKWVESLSFDSERTRFLLDDPETIAITLVRVFCRCAHRLLVVTADTTAAEDLAGLLGTYLEMLDLPGSVTEVPEVTTVKRNEWVPQNESRRCAVLERTLGDDPGIFVLSVGSLLAPAVSPEVFRENIFTVSVGDSETSPEGLAAKLVELDYDNEPEVGMPGEFTVRGGIVDVFSPAHEAPIRVEFFGNVVDSMRFFLPDTQRSFRTAQTLRVLPRGSVVVCPPEKTAGQVLDYFNENIPVAVCEPGLVEEHLERFAESGYAEIWNQIQENADRLYRLITDPSETPATDSGQESVFRSGCVSLGADFSVLLPELGEGASLWHWQQLRDHLLRWDGMGLLLGACCTKEGEVERFRQMLDEDPETSGLSVEIEVRRLPCGVMIPEAGAVILSDFELFGRSPKIRTRKRSKFHLDRSAAGEIDLEPGCYAVHAGHGICQYHGVEQVEQTGEVQEVMVLEFSDDVKLYVPMEQNHLVSRYVGGTKKLPRLSRMGTQSWSKARASAESAVWDLASELLRLEAVRKNSQGIVFESMGDWEGPFFGAFPYVETEDQSEAISAVLQDMESPEPMDRLLCGDVGYGKTEVAMRAAFRAVVNDRQVALLVPTTVLAQQHFVTFRERMAEYPIEVEMISRFKTRKEQKTILDRLALGRVDIVIGTHRLLQNDVAFDQLGLVIIDEEQRFGVKHKERFKKLRASVDILTMTATPIPRTLYFSISGIKNLSTIMTAPEERLPVTTIVAQYDRQLIREAVRREVQRQGQVYFLHNRVKSIEKVAQNLRLLIPDAKIAVAHGQMPGDNLASVMGSFMRGDVDVLVCTTIIESGIDIPNANTIIIDRADRFGLADLYQLRGRVGRFHHQAYAYLLLPPMGTLPENARKRLRAIRKYTHLGAGFKLALRDLEIRGAGNILGTEQSGHIAAVGFKLYCDLLGEAVERLEDEGPVRRRVPVPVTMDTLVLGLRGPHGTEAAALPSAYIAEQSTRINCYRRISVLNSTADVDGFCDELADRFGPVPSMVKRLMKVSKVRILAEAAGAVALAVRDRRVMLETDHGFHKTSSGDFPLLVSEQADGQLEELMKLLTSLHTV